METELPKIPDEVQIIVRHQDAAVRCRTMVAISDAFGQLRDVVSIELQHLPQSMLFKVMEDNAVMPFTYKSLLNDTVRLINLDAEGKWEANNAIDICVKTNSKQFSQDLIVLMSLWLGLFYKSVRTDEVAYNPGLLSQIEWFDELVILEGPKTEAEYLKPIESPVKDVVIYSDGACKGNPGPGGWGVVLRYPAKNVEKNLKAAQPRTTNNRMELSGAIAGLKALKEPCNVMLYTDSKYVIKGIEEWIEKWVANNWRTGTNKPVKNKDLWEELWKQTRRHSVTFNWVKGHSGDKYNDLADELANSAIQDLLASDCDIENYRV